MKDLICKLEETQNLSKAEWTALIEACNPDLSEFLFEKARAIRIQNYGHDVYIRGLIEYTNYCKNNCYYCGIRRDNREVPRYRLSKEDILSCCRTGHELGFRTFVLQGGEDPYFTDERMIDLIKDIRSEFSDCAITLSIGEKSYESYKNLFDAGADRFLLRHETFNAKHYSQLHPKELSAANRQKCLFDLRKIGYQTGSGFMVGSPGQTADNLAEDMIFLKKLNPHMIGIGPFIPHHSTPFKDEKAGTLELTLFMLALLRLMIPKVLLPSTTALGTIQPDGRKKGILAGANVVMPNLSPADNRKNYSLYDNKRCMGDEAAEGLAILKQEMNEIGYQVVTSRGDSLVDIPSNN